MTSHIQQLTSANLDALRRIAPDVFDHDVDDEQARAFVDDPRHVMFIAVNADTVVGMASAVEYFHPDKPPQLWINEIGVTPSHRRQGIGRGLIQALLAEAKSRGCAYAWLGTDVDNDVAQACFGSVPRGAAPQPFLLFEWDLDE